jgi:hypothetical protein
LIVRLRTKFILPRHPDWASFGIFLQNPKSCRGWKVLVDLVEMVKSADLAAENNLEIVCLSGTEQASG